MNISFKTNDDKTSVTVSANWEVQITKPSEELTQGQYNALKAYCQRIVGDRIKTSMLALPIKLTSCKIFSIADEDRRIDDYYYDAETGNLFSHSTLVKQIADGHHEIRIKSTNSQETA